MTSAPSVVPRSEISGHTILAKPKEIHCGQHLNSETYLRCAVVRRNCGLDSARRAASSSTAAGGSEVLKALPHSTASTSSMATILKLLVLIRPAFRSAIKLSGVEKKTVFAGASTFAIAACWSAKMALGASTRDTTSRCRHGPATPSKTSRGRLRRHCRCCFASCMRIGRTKVSVLPDPVCATVRTSRPLVAGARASACIMLGANTPSLCRDDASWGLPMSSAKPGPCKSL